MGDITSANAIIQIAVPGIFTIPQQLQGFSADDVFGTDEIEAAELSMGVDGNLSAGFKFVMIPQRYMFQADSPSIAIFDAWYATEKATVTKFAASGTCLLSSVGKSYSMLVGYLSKYKPIPDAKKMLEHQEFTITWQAINPAPFTATVAIVL